MSEPHEDGRAIPDDVVATEWLRRRVENLSDLPVMWSRGAYTNRRTSHIAFANGSVKEEGEYAHDAGDDVLALADITYEAIKAYRDEVAAPRQLDDYPPQAALVWRTEPEVSRDAGRTMVYCRLCFERGTMLGVAA